VTPSSTKWKSQSYAKAWHDLGFTFSVTWCPKTPGIHSKTMATLFSLLSCEHAPRSLLQQFLLPADTDWLVLHPFQASMSYHVHTPQHSLFHSLHSTFPTIFLTFQPIIWSYLYITLVWLFSFPCPIKLLEVQFETLLFGRVSASHCRHSVNFVEGVGKK
jgi:hypothetical protein